MSALTEITEDFVAGYAPRGQQNKRGYLSRWERWATATGVDPVAPSRVDLDRYRTHLVETLGTPKSVNAALSVMRTWAGWMVEEDHWEKNPAQYLQLLPAPSQVRLAWLTDGETAAFLDHVDRVADPVMRGMVNILVAYGTRPQETRLIDQGDVDLVGDSITFRHRKDGRSSTYAVTAAARDAVEPLLTGEGSAPLFLNEYTGMRISKHVAQKRFNRLVRSAPIPRVTMYGLRASFATNALEAGIAERDVQDAMGHVSPAQTAQYDQLRRARASVAQRAGAKRIAALRGRAGGA